MSDAAATEAEKAKAAKELEALKKQLQDKEAEISRLNATPEEREAMRKREAAKAKIAEMRNDPEIARILDEQKEAAKGSATDRGGLKYDKNGDSGKGRVSSSERKAAKRSSGARHKRSTSAARRSRSRSPRRSRERADREDGEVTDFKLSSGEDESDAETDDDMSAAAKSKKEKPKLSVSDPHQNPVLKTIGREVRRTSSEAASENPGKIRFNFPPRSPGY